MANFHSGAHEHWDRPQLDGERKNNEARRFTTLVDMCYEHHVRLICSMAGPPEEILGGLSEEY